MVASQLDEESEQSYDDCSSFIACRKCEAFDRSFDPISPKPKINRRLRQDAILQLRRHNQRLDSSRLKVWLLWAEG